MVELKNISKFFLALTKAGGQLSRTDLAVKIFKRNWSAKKLDELLAVPQLAGLIDSTKEPIRGKGRKALRYILTPLGWQIARTWKLPVKADRISPEEVQHQFGLLVKDAHPWAKALERDAGLWRQHAEQEKQLREKKAAEREEKERIQAQNPTKDPANKKPHRSRGAKSDADRADFFFRKLREKEGEPAVTPQPAAPTPSPARISAAPSSVPGVHGGVGGFRTSAPAIPVQLWSRLGEEKEKPPDPKDLELAQRIKNLGLFRVEGVEVAYGLGMIHCREWIKRHPEYASLLEGL
jgi:hypothetical protein